MALGNHFEQSFAQTRQRLALDPVRIRASAAPVRVIVDIIRSVSGFDEDEFFALMDQLTDLRVRAIQAPQDGDRYSDVSQRLKFFASDIFARTDRLLLQPGDARKEDFGRACSELSDKIRHFAGEYGAHDGMP